VALQRHQGVVLGHPDTVIGHPHEGTPTCDQLDVEAPRLGVQSVLHQLFDHRRRPFDHLAGGNPVHHRVGQNPNPRHHGRITEQTRVSIPHPEPVPVLVPDNGRHTVPRG
jgi:hypothetical protein